MILREEALGDLELEPRRGSGGGGFSALRACLSLLLLCSCVLCHCGHPLLAESLNPCVSCFYNHKEHVSPSVFYTTGGRKSVQQSWPLSASPGNLLQAENCCHGDRVMPCRHATGSRAVAEEGRYQTLSLYCPSMTCNNPSIRYSAPQWL